MPWKGVTTVDLRREFVRLAIQAESPFSSLCRAYNISRKTGYKWLKRYKKDGDAGLNNIPTTPTHSPRKTNEEIEKLVICVREQHPAWGGRKIRAWLQQRGHIDVPASSTITDILRRHGFISPPDRTDHAFCRFEKTNPNQLWQMDFKGHFKMLNQQRCHPLTVLDDHSRFSIVLGACEDERRDTVKFHLERAFERYGLPDAINVDNGSPWGGGGHSRFSQLTVWLIQLGIYVSYSRPYHPQTNGKDERFHRTLKGELLSHVNFKDINDAKIKLKKWREIYNLERPHEALDMQPPIHRYRRSQRKYTGIREDIEYAPEDQIRKVEKRGIVSFCGKRIIVGEGFAGKKVAIRASNKDGVFNLYFCHQIVKTINMR